ncbi:DMT family transporter [Sphingomonas sp. MMS24-J45]|uniref:DMT family transporter n=1 Tax=Sphingomonas sp. MMS24-J45 TaxID=3238806 RepID=UPI0038506931
MSVGLFAGMNTCIKLAEGHGAALGEILFWRQFGAAVLVGGIVLAGPGWRSVATTRMPAHLLRAALGLTAMAFTFMTILALPLAEATTIGFTMPIFATILGALVLGEPTGWHRWLAVLVGFAGVVIVAQPGGGGFPIWGSVTGLIAAFLTAGVSILLRQIGKTEAAMTTVFWFSTLSVVPLGLIYIFVAKAHPAETWSFLIGVGLLGGAAQLAMTSALGLGPVSVVVPMDYSSLIWATLFGWLVFDTLPGPATWIGAPIIVGSGLYIVWREHVRRQTETTQAVMA